MNRAQRRSNNRMELNKRHMSDRVLDGLLRVGFVKGTAYGDLDPIVRNPAYNEARIEFELRDHLGRKIEYNTLPFRYATQEDFPDNPVPPYIYKSCLK